MRFIKLFENFNEITLPDVAWLYFLHYIYRGTLTIKDWQNDQRMGVKCDDSLRKFPCVKIEDGGYKSSDECVKIIDKYFGAKTFEDAVRKRKDLKEYKKKDQFYGYSVDNIPYDLFLKKNPTIDKAFDTIKNRIVEHYNSQGSYTRIIDRLAKSRRIKEFNFKQYFNALPDEPKSFKVYRGIKNEYDERRDREGYSCWTLGKGQAERFAKYYFTGGMQFRPEYSKNPHVLEAEVSFDDVAVFIGDSEGEAEVILKNPVKINSITKVETQRNTFN